MEEFFSVMISKYGYLAIGIGTFLEGEIILILAALMVTQGQMHLEGVIIAAAAGAFLGDIASYLLGSWKVDYVLTKMPAVRKLLPRAQNIIRRFGSVSILLSRFFYGLRVPTSVICGMSKFRFARFLPIALVGCTLWAVVWTGATYLVGQSISHVFLDFQKYQAYIFIGMAVILPLALVIRRMTVKKA